MCEIISVEFETNQFTQAITENSISTVNKKCVESHSKVCFGIIDSNKIHLISNSVQNEFHANDFVRINDEGFTNNTFSSKNESTRKSSARIRLISDYILGASNTRRFEANTILGIFENNKTSLSDTYNFRVGIKFYFNAAVTVGSVISIRFQVTASSTSLPSVQRNVPITSIIMPPTTAPLSKYPILTLRKVEPYYSEPMAQFTATLEARVRFMMDFLYSPIVIQFNTTGGTLNTQTVFTMGNLLDTMTPIGLSTTLSLVNTHCTRTSAVVLSIELSATFILGLTSSGFNLLTVTLKFSPFSGTFISFNVNHHQREGFERGYFIHSLIYGEHCLNYRKSERTRMANRARIGKARNTSTSST
ncbi:unnamed protein product [Trichobilharzia regenti]|nr:unnamed protein product [Trichobilharzia regenti]